MTREAFTEGDLSQPRQWRLQYDWSRKDPRVVEITCPRGACRLDISARKIDDTGWVSPTVRCECGWHGRVVLAGWRGKEMR